MSDIYISEDGDAVVDLHMVLDTADAEISRLKAERDQLREENEATMKEAAKFITELCQTFNIPLPVATLDKLEGNNEKR